ncbi:MAG: FAD-dependent oxidoreductase [Acidobacteria bacterium]|nr:FAD-dependent oxidoreductase [Acidobacteriota bacterium]
MTPFDVLVVGGGNAGCTAAITAARLGARVCLVERYGFLGGTATAAMVAPWMTYHAGSADESGRITGGLAQEFVERLVAMGASPGHLPDASDYVPTITPFDPEAHKWLLMAMCEEAGVHLLLHATFLATIVEGDRVAGVRVQTVSGQREVHARRTIDCSADALVAHAAGVPCELGNADGLVQPMTMMFRLSHVDLDRTAAWLREHPDQIRTSLPPERFSADTLTAIAGLWRIWQEARAAGDVDIPREIVSLFRGAYRDEVTVNMTRVTGLNPLDADDLTRAEIETRRQTMALVAFFRTRVPGFESCRLAATPAQVGVRESRRILGEYILTGDDLLEGRAFPDAVARSAYPIDIHNPAGEGTTTVRLPEGRTYEIPYRCLVPLVADDLLVAGRCISVTHEALASTRLTPTIMTLGQAAATAVVQSLHAGVPPRHVDTGVLRASLVAQGVDLRRPEPVRP